jgi:LemA protein
MAQTICKKSVTQETSLESDGAEVDMRKGLVVLIVLVVIALILGSSFISRRNQMAIKREAVNAAWAQVDVVLQRRADLIPNLVETVKGIAVQEQIVFGDIAKARSALLGARSPAEKIAANGQLDSALGRLLVIVENYPQLKSNENFLRLQDELAGTENRIAVERRRYNETVQDYNTFIAVFPNSLVASLSGFARNDAYFKTDEGARQAPSVKFDYGNKPATPSPAPTPVPAKP